MTPNFGRFPRPFPLFVGVALLLSCFVASAPFLLLPLFSHIGAQTGNIFYDNSTKNCRDCSLIFFPNRRVPTLDLLSLFLFHFGDCLVLRYRLADYWMMAPALCVLNLCTALMVI